MNGLAVNRTRLRILRAVLGGLLIAVGIGLGAFNAWWVALFFGVPLVLSLIHI